MAIVINGSGTVTGISVGGLPDSIVDSDTLASGIDKTSITDGGNATAITIDATENVGIGVVPEDWHSAYDGGIVQINSQGGIFSQGAETYITNNVYEPQSGGMKYINTNVATLYSQQTGAHYFRVAPSGSADAAISWTEAMKIDNSGRVTKPVQPAFLGNHNTTTSNISNGTAIPFNTTIFDQNSDFHASNGVFTAPVTGRYQFSFLVSVTELDASATYSRILLKCSNRTVPFGITHANQFSGDPGYYSFEGSLLLDMDANDTCFLEWNQAGGANQADVFDSTYFSGYLAC